MSFYAALFLFKKKKKSLLNAFLSYVKNFELPRR